MAVIQSSSEMLCQPQSDSDEVQATLLSSSRRCQFPSLRFLVKDHNPESHQSSWKMATVRVTQCTSVPSTRKNHSKCTGQWEPLGPQTALYNQHQSLELYGTVSLLMIPIQYLRILLWRLWCSKVEEKDEKKCRNQGSCILIWFGINKPCNTSISGSLSSYRGW